MAVVFAAAAAGLGGTRYCCCCADVSVPHVKRFYVSSWSRTARVECFFSSSYFRIILLCICFPHSRVASNTVYVQVCVCMCLFVFVSTYVTLLTVFYSLSSFSLNSFLFLFGFLSFFFISSTSSLYTNIVTVRAETATQLFLIQNVLRVCLRVFYALFRSDQKKQQICVCVCMSLFSLKNLRQFAWPINILLT